MTTEGTVKIPSSVFDLRLETKVLVARTTSSALKTITGFKFLSEQTGQEIVPPKQNNDRNGHYSVTFHKGYKLFAGVRVNGEKAVLQGPGSGVQLHIPEGRYGFIFSHTHTDPALFQDNLLEFERLLPPIVEYSSSLTSKCSNGSFKIKVPHYARNRDMFQQIRVWHRDIYDDVPFTLSSVGEAYLDEQFITIQTANINQLICTIGGCQERCHGIPKAFIFGRITPLRYPPITSALRIYMCNPLYDITDFEQVVLLPSANKVCGKVIFLPVCVILSIGGACVVRGTCMAGEGLGACVAGGVCGGSGMRGEGACVAKGGVHGMHAPPSVTTRYGRSMHGRYASYWNAFLFY